MEALSVDISAEIRNENDKFESIIGEGNAGGIADLYTNDGMLLPAGSEIIKGREGIESYWQSVVDMGVKQAKLELVEVEHHGETAIELGHYTFTGQNSQTIDQGKYIAVWKRKDKQWKLQKDIWNSNSTPQ